MDAKEKYNPSFGVSFGAYARIRIRGAILDDIRHSQYQCQPRFFARERRILQKAVHRLEQKLSRQATTAEIAESLCMSLKKTRDLIRDMEVTVVSNEVVPIDNLKPDPTSSPLEQVIAKEEVRLISEGLSCLTEKQKVVMRLYYGEGLNLLQVGGVMGTCESRASQSKIRSTEKIKNWIEKNYQERENE